MRTKGQIFEAFIFEYIEDQIDEKPGITIKEATQKAWGQYRKGGDRAFREIRRGRQSLTLRDAFDLCEAIGLDFCYVCFSAEKLMKSGKLPLFLPFFSDQDLVTKTAMHFFRAQDS